MEKSTASKLKKQTKALEKLVAVLPKDDAYKKIFTALSTFCAEMTAGLERLSLATDDLHECVIELCEDVCDIEDAVFGDEEPEDSDEMVELTCPLCKKPVPLDYLDLSDEKRLICPHCKKNMMEAE